MPGPAPKPNRRNRMPLRRGDPQNAAGHGWSHGTAPHPPPDITDRGKRIWRIWMQSWVASFWKPEDIPGLETTIRLYDRNLTQPSNANANELGKWMDRYALTPKGRQERRWLPPKEDELPDATPSTLPRLHVIGG